MWSSLKLFNSNIPQIDLIKQNIQENVSHLDGNPDLINLNELFYIGKCLLKEAGKKIVVIRKEAELKLEHKERDNSIVTKADLESHTILVETLKHKFKNLKINSEENDQEKNNFDPKFYLEICDNYKHETSDKFAYIDDINVWIDPLDATQEYSENLIDYVTIMFCIVHNNVPRAGIIHKPFTETTVSSFFENKKLNEQGVPKHIKIVVSRSHAGLVKSIINNRLNNSEIITAAGSGYKTLTLLENKSDLYLHTSKIYKWDICAPNAILNNLGGKLTRRDGKFVDYSNNQEKDKSVDGIIAALHNHPFYFDTFKL